MTDPANSDVALAANILDILDREYREGPQWNDAEMRSMASALAAAAERADEWEQKAKSRLATGMEQERLKLAAEAALLVAQEELLEAKRGWQAFVDFEEWVARAERAEATNTRLREALKIYADARHWGISRDDYEHPVCAWIGPGAIKTRGVPDGPETARAALAQPAEQESDPPIWSEAHEQRQRAADRLKEKIMPPHAEQENAGVMRAEALTPNKETEQSNER